MDGESHLAQVSVDHQFNADWSAHFGYSYNRETYDANQLRTTGVDPVKGTMTRSNDATHGSLSTDSYGIGYVNGKLMLAGCGTTCRSASIPNTGASTARTCCGRP